MKRLQPMHDLKYKLLFGILSLLNLGLFAQNANTIKESLKNVTTIDSARVFMQQNADLKSKLYTYNQEKHTNNLSKKLFSLKDGDTYVIAQKNDSAVYKVISITPTKHYRASYIYFDGKKKEKATILSLREEINLQLKNGIEFKNLAGQHSMDRNARRGGDLGWIKEENIFPEFIEALKTHKIGDVFTLDLNEKKRHYLIKKTDSTKNINLLTVLKVTL